MLQERRLGRGLEALLGRPIDQGPAASSMLKVEEEDEGHGFQQISVSEIDSNPYQPRTEFDDAEIQALADSIIEHGLLQPLVVRRAGNRYQLIAGERRLKAVTRAGFDNVMVQIKDADDRQLAEMAIVENLQRKDLNALEKAHCFQQYLQRYGCTQEELAGRLQIDRSTVANFIRLLELPEQVQQALRDGKLTQGHARALLPLGEEREQVAFAAKIQQEGLSVRATEALVQETIRAVDREPLAVFTGDEAPAAAPKAPRSRNENLQNLEQELRTALGTKVELKQTKAGSGRMVIHFANAAEFARLREQMHLCAGQSKSSHAA